MNLIIHNLLNAIKVFWKMINNIPINTYYLKHQQELYGLIIEFSNLITYADDWNVIHVNYQS